jgi:catecholate siderophore receptor
MQIMTPRSHFRHWRSRTGSTRTVVSLALFTLFGGLGFAQAVPPLAATERAVPRAPTAAEVARAASTTGNSTSTAADEVLTLSPFEVRPEEDQGYKATRSLAGTSLSSDLKDIAAAVTVITKDFMNDVNATDAVSLLAYTPNMEVAGYGGNFSGISDGSAGGVFDDALLQTNAITRSRGLLAADHTRNYFLTDISFDSYNLDRLEINRGANGILFGLGSPGGIINTSTTRGELRKNKTSVSAAVGSYGSYRGTLDHNHVLIKNKLALRLDTMFDNLRFRVNDAYSKRKGVTLSGTYQPFKNTIVRVSSEIGRTDRNSPETRAPFDRYTWWWLAGKPVWNPVAQTGRLLGTPTAPFTNTSIIAANGTRVATPVSYLTANWGASAPNEPLLFYTDPHSSQIGGINIGGGATVDGIKSFADNAYLNPAGTGLQAGGWVGLNSWATIQQNIYQGTNPQRVLYSREPMITDPKVFDFYHNMLSGPTKYEWNWYDSSTATIEQSFLERRAGFELAFYKEHSDGGGLSPNSYALNLDINETMPNGAPNPNFLRPLAIGSGFKRVFSKDRDAVRLKGHFDFDFRRLKGPSWLGRAIGQHQLIGTYSRQNSLYQQFGGSPWNAGLDWNPSNGQGIGSVSSTARIIALGHYLAPSVQTTSSPKEVGLIAPTVGQNPSGPTMTILTHHRPAVTTPAALQAWTVDTLGLLANPVHGVTQIRNASGYADRTEQQVHSLALALQSRWFHNNVVTTGGWRRDQGWSFDSGLPTNNPATGVANTDWNVWYPKLSRAVVLEQKNYGIVGHVPRFLREKLPLGTEVSGFYNYGTNFRIAQQRFTITGEPLPTETGETKEYGVRLSTFHGRLDFKVTHYVNISDKTSAGNLNGAIGQLAFVVPSVIQHNINGENASNPTGIAQFESWVAGTYGQTFVNAFHANLVPNNDPAFPAATYGKYASGNDDRGQITAVSAVESTGWEYELTFNPLRNWRLSANMSSTQAVRTKIAPELYDFIFNPNGGLLSLVQNADGTPTAAGRLIGTPTTGTGAGALQTFVVGNILNNGVITTFAQEGTKSDELSKWRGSITTSYSFTDEFFGGRLKGWAIGGSVRASDNPLLGYAGKTIVSSGTSLAVSDLTRPIFGAKEIIYDGMISYGRRLGRNIQWKAQLNIRNIGVGNSLKPLYAWPDGTVVYWAIRDPQRLTLTNSFSF